MSWGDGWFGDTAESWFQGGGSGNATIGESGGLGTCAIAGREYVMDVPESEQATLDALRNATDQSAEPGDQSLSTIGIWKRIQTNWRYGAGQPFFDDDDSDDRRFRYSKGIDIWEQTKLKLLPNTVVRRAAADATWRTCAAGTKFYVSHGSTVVHTSDPSVASPTWTSAGAPGGTVTSLVTDGAKVYAAIGTDVKQQAIGATSWTTLSTYDATILGYMHGRLLAAKAGQIAEISSGGTATVLFDHFNPSAEIVAMSPGPKGIFIALNAGDRGEFLFISFNAATGGLTVPVAAGTLNAGEKVLAMDFYHPAQLIGTTRGFRVGQIVDDNGIAPGPVIEDPGPVTAVAGYGEFVYFSWTNIDSTSTGIGKADISIFTTKPFVPAYASDLMAGTTGSTVQGTVQTIATFNGKRYFTVGGVGLYGQDNTLVPTGTWKSGLIRFGSSEKKILTTIDLRHEPLNGQVSVDLALEDTTTLHSGDSTTQGSLSPASPLTAGSSEVEFPELILTLTRSSTDTTKGPVIRRWALRSAIVPIRTDVIVWCLLFKTTLISPKTDIAMPFDPLSEWLYLKQVESARQFVVAQDGERNQTVMVDKVTIKPEKFDPNFRWYEGKVYVQMFTSGPASLA